MPESQSENKPIRSRLLWMLTAGLLLTFGFLSFVYLGSLLAQRHLDGSSVVQMQMAFAIYAKVVLFKGLLPQLLLALIFWSVFFNRISVFRDRGRGGLFLGLLLSAAVASLIVIPTVFSWNLPGFPAVRFSGFWNVVSTSLEMTAAVTAAMFFPKLLLK